MIFDVELHCKDWKMCSCRWSNLDGGFWCNEDCKPKKPANAVEKVLSVNGTVYILYANGTWRKKKKRSEIT